MASTYSANLRLELIGTGEQQGQWGATTNANLGTLLEQAIGGFESITVGGTDVTLTTADGAVDQARNMVLNFTGTPGAARNVICPAAEKIYIVKNATTGGFAVTMKTAAQVTGISIPNGATAVLYVDGTNVNLVSQKPVPVTLGGTGASTAAGAATNLGLGTGDSPQFAGVNVGNASDTTITRSAAGVLAVEGGVIPKENRTNTFTAAQTINGASLLLNSNNDYEPQTLLTHAGATAGSGAYSILNRARGTYTSPTIVSSGDQLGNVLFQGYDGTAYRSAASIEAQVDGTPGANDMPGRLTFKTTPDGGTAATERMRITNAGDVGIGTTPTAKLDIVGPAGGTSLRLTDNTNSTLTIKHESPGNLLSYETNGTANQRWVLNGSERMRIDNAGNVGIGVTSVADKLHVQGATSTYMRVTSTNAGTGAGIRFTNATGQWLIGAGPQSGLADFQFYDGNASSERMKIDSSGNVIVTGPGGLGYGTGSGGTITQLGSKSAGVTLNKTNGRIITTADPLASATTVQIQLNNTTISATDVVCVTLASGDANLGLNYNVWVGSTSAGACVINIKNISGGQRDEALTLNFAVIKAVTSAVMNCPLPRYYLCHAVIALIIAAVLWWPLGLTAGLAAGVAFYAGREYTQWESGLSFDWKGIAAPLVVCLVVLLLTGLWHNMIEELVSRVFKTRNQSHLSHWKTKSFAEHQALGGFYDDVISTLDKLVEATQGSKGIIGHVDLSCKDESVEIIKCLTDDANWISKNRSKIASGVPALENIVDEIVAVYLSTIYKLKNLS